MRQNENFGGFIIYRRLSKTVETKLAVQESKQINNM